MPRAILITEEWKTRFWMKVKKTGGCWLWTASTAGKGYGQLPIPGQQRCIYAHRFSYLIHHGAIPNGMQVCHTCDNPGCVRPDHLFLGTSADNHADMAAKKRSTYGERNVQARLTEADIRKILGRLSEGVAQRAIAKEFGVQQMQISRISRGHRWGHVTGVAHVPTEAREEITPDQVRAVRKMLADGVPQARIAKHFGISQSHVSRINTGERWADVK